jgi:hypothetical protein
MLHPEILRALAAERNEQIERSAAEYRLIVSARPKTRPHRHRWPTNGLWRRNRPWGRAAAGAPIQL